MAARGKNECGKFGCFFVKSNLKITIDSVEFCEDSGTGGNGLDNIIDRRER